MNVDAFPLSLPVVAGLLVLFTTCYQLNARVTPWATWHVRGNGRYMQSWWSYVVLNWASAALVVGLVLLHGAGPGAIGLSLPSREVAAVLALAYLSAVGLYYWGVVAREPLDERALERGGDGWTPATHRQRVLGVFTFSLSPGICEEIVYRGFAVTALLSFGYSQSVAVGVATLAYVLLHGRGATESVQSFGHYAVLGVVFAAIYLRTGSLWFAIVAHAAYNLLVTVQHTRDYLAGDRSERSGPSVGS